ncbi:AAA family ATPase [Marinomonas primoryensis]|uniref:ATP-binding protein n=1 Tax=Marinomonas primoryensis TaxID=178399 RepID=A0ABV0L4Y5_9GAMM
MIVDITIANFRSIKDKQTFSLYAENQSSHLEDNIVYPGDTKYGVHRTAGVYGANASGKSNLLLAFMALRYVATSSGDLKEGDKINYEPYLLSNSTKNAPIEFEIEFFLKDGLRYLYNITYNGSQILTESLDYYPSRSKANLFKRLESDTWEDITFGSHYKGGKKKIAFFKNNSYLSKAGNSADSPEIIREIFNFFRQDFSHAAATSNIGAFGWKKDPEMISVVSKILNKVDTGIVDIEFEDDKDVLKNYKFPDSISESIKKEVLEELSKKAFFSHIDDHFEKVLFDKDLESTGTLKLFEMLPVLLKTFEKGGVLLLDELDNSFHPHIAELIIKLFNSKEVNKKNAQLIFSTHNLNLMSPKIFRRDQIWLTEKNNGSTLITSLDEFNKNTVKMNSPFNKWYDDGRFGAIPEIDFYAISKAICNKGKNNA